MKTVLTSLIVFNVTKMVLFVIYLISILMLSENYNSLTCHNPAEIKGLMDFG